MNESVTSERILDVAQVLVQQRGFNAVSYKDIAARLGIKHPSIHYHFANKAKLGAELVKRYRRTFNEELVNITSIELSGRRQLERYRLLYERLLRGNETRFCLCGMLAADAKTLPETMRREVQEFFEDNQSWLTRVLEEAQADGSLRNISAPAKQAAAIFAGVEGALLLAHANDTPETFHTIVDGLLLPLFNTQEREL